jgi:hypothetical protein
MLHLYNPGVCSAAVTDNCACRLRVVEHELPVDVAAGADGVIGLECPVFWDHEGERIDVLCCDFGIRTPIPQLDGESSKELKIPGSALSLVCAIACLATNGVTLRQYHSHSGSQHRGQAVVLNCICAQRHRYMRRSVLQAMPPMFPVARRMANSAPLLSATTSAANVRIPARKLLASEPLT